MKKIVLAVCLAIIATIGLCGIALTSPKPTIVTPDDLKWSPFPGLPGAQVAVLYGDPNSSGSYTIRLKLADGTKLAPHWHPDDERVTVLSGTFMVGLGDEMDASKMTALPAGSFVYLPAGIHHYAMAKGDVVIQSTGMGPFKMNVVKSP